MKIHGFTSLKNPIVRAKNRKYGEKRRVQFAGGKTSRAKYHENFLPSSAFSKRSACYSKRELEISLSALAPSFAFERNLRWTNILVVISAIKKPEQGTREFRERADPAAFQRPSRSPSKRKKEREDRRCSAVSALFARSALFDLSSFLRLINGNASEFTGSAPSSRRRSR